MLHQCFRAWEPRSSVPAAAQITMSKPIQSLSSRVGPTVWPRCRSCCREFTAHSCQTPAPRLTQNLRHPSASETQRAMLAPFTAAQRTTAPSSTTVGRVVPRPRAATDSEFAALCPTSSHACFFFARSSSATVVFPSFLFEAVDTALQTMNFLHALCHASLVLSCPSRLFSCLIRSFEGGSTFCFALETRNVP